LFAPSAGIISPYEAAIALAENSRENGARILLGTEALSIAVTNGKVKSVKTDKGEINPSYIVNAAGLFADKISSMVGLSDFQITPRKGEYLIYDNALGEFVKHPLFPIPTPISKGILVSPTVDGNIIVGPMPRK
jgi:glycerol-3-phosphate dehydrogenase